MHVCGGSGGGEKVCVAEGVFVRVYSVVHVGACLHATCHLQDGAMSHCKR